MNKPIFFTNKLLNPNFQKQLNIPLEFVCFGLTRGKMYKHLGNKDNFIMTTDEITRNWGNNVIYGGIFICKDFDYYSRILDSYFLCSLSTLYVNHDYDTCHRVNISVTPIFFNSLDELARLKYRESEEKLTTVTYIGNLKNPKIKQRMDTTNNTYRIQSGIDAENFKELFWEVYSEQRTSSSI